MKDIIPFEFDGLTVRTVDIDGATYFVGKDVAEALGYANAADAISKHCKGVAKRYPLQTSGGLQELRVLTESDVLRLIIQSALPAADRFERWVFEDVLPTIRKTGTYGTQRQLTPAELLLAQAGVLVDIERRQIEQEARTARQAEQLEVVQFRVEEVASTSALPQRPANSEAISHIKTRLFKEYGIPAHVVEFVLRQSPYQLKPAAMVKHNVEEAQGGTYAVFWTKDVNAVFRRFVRECQRATAAFVIHPYVADRFKLKPGIEGASQ